MRPIKILHVLGSLNRGGIETWMTNIVRLGRPEMRIDFLLSAGPGESGDYERIVQDAGCRIFHIPKVSSLVRRLRALGLCRDDPTLRTLLRAGCYDVVHIHGNEFGGDIAKESHAIGTPVRVVHCHSTTLARGKRGVEMAFRRARFAYLGRPRIRAHATDWVACGRDAGRFMMGDDWGKDSRCKVVYCGVPLADFHRVWTSEDRRSLLALYGLPSDSIVVGHAGSMGPQPVKNHDFLIRAFAKLSLRDPRYRLIMCGDGPLRGSFESRVRQLGLSEKVRFAGLVRNIPALMAHLFDVHVLPSLAEGLPVVVIEAAASGLYTVMSENVTDEIVEHLPGRIERVSLDAPLAYWADRIERGVALREGPAAGADRVGRTPLSIAQSAEQLIRLYQSRLASVRGGSEA